MFVFIKGKKEVHVGSKSVQFGCIDPSMEYTLMSVPRKGEFVNVNGMNYRGGKDGMAIITDDIDGKVVKVEWYFSRQNNYPCINIWLK